MLFNHIDKIAEMAFPKKYLSFAKLDIFLKIQGNCLRSTEIFHLIRNLDTQFLAETEKVINCMSGCKYYSSVIGDLNAMFSERLGPNAFNLNEFSETDVKVKLFDQLRIWRLVVFRLRL